MASLMRQLTVGRGLDPREFTLVAFGGAGPMHAIFLAEELGIGTVLIPHSPGTFSAHGMLEAEIRHDLVHAYFARWDRIDRERVREAIRNLTLDANLLLQEDHAEPKSATLAVTVDMRYVGQEYFLTLPAGNLDDKVLKQFHSLYKRTFGHSNPEELVEIVNLRLTATSAGAHARPLAHALDSGNGKPYDSRPVRFGGQTIDTPRFRREDLKVGVQLKSPCIIDEESCTTVIPGGWLTAAHPNGWLEVRKA